MVFGKKKKGKGPDWSDEALSLDGPKGSGNTGHMLLAPRADEPAEFAPKAKRRYGIMTKAIWVTLALVPIGLITYLNTATEVANIRAEFSEYQSQQEADETAAETEGRVLALAAARDWLTSDLQTINGPHDLIWNYTTLIGAQTGFENRNSSVLSDDQDGPVTPEVSMWSHVLSFLDANGQGYSIEVLVAADQAGNIQVIGDPGLVPYAPSAEVDVSTVWPGAVTLTPPEPVENAVGAWLNAYTSGDPVALRQTVGDPDSNHSYMPLVGLTSLGFDIEAATVPNDLVDANGDLPDNPETLVVRVNVVLTAPEGTPVQGTAEPEGMTIQYDLLIARANTATPAVVAWGGPGTGLTLEAFQNSISGRTLQIEEPSADPSEDPSETTSTDTQEG